MITCCDRRSTVSNRSGVLYKASDAHTKTVTFSRPASWTKLGRSWVTDHESCRGLTWGITLTLLDTLMLGVLSGVSVLHMLDDPNHASVKNVRESSGELPQDQRLERADTSTHTTESAISFRTWPADAHSRRLVRDDQSQPSSECLARITSFQVR